MTTECIWKCSVSFRVLSEFNTQLLLFLFQGLNKPTLGWALPLFVASRGWTVKGGASASGQRDQGRTGVGAKGGHHSEMSVLLGTI